MHSPSYSSSATWVLLADWPLRTHHTPRWSDCGLEWKLTKPSVLLRLVGTGGRMERDQHTLIKCAVLLRSVPARTWAYLDVPVCTLNNLNLSIFEIDSVTYFPMHRDGQTLIYILCLFLGGTENYLSFLRYVLAWVCRYVLPYTNEEFSNCHVLSCIGMYWYIMVHTILPDPVQGYRIPNDLFIWSISYHPLSTWSPWCCASQIW